MLCLSLSTLGTIASLLVAGVTTAAHLQKEPSTVRRCNQCRHQEEGSPVAGCDRSKSTIQCPTEVSHCAITVASPDFAPSLVCTEETEESCTLLYSPTERVYRLTCVCGNDLCNEPLHEQLISELKQFTSNTASSSNVTNSTDVTDLFLNSSHLYRDATRHDLFSAFVKNESNFELNGTQTHANNRTAEMVLEQKARIVVENVTAAKKRGPRAEALKHEVAAAPSDDDEDEGEGSGAWGEDGRSPRRPASAPAAPDSYLPAHDNKGSSIFISPIVTTPFLLHLII